MPKIKDIFICVLIASLILGTSAKLFADGQITANQGYAGSDPWPVSMASPVTNSGTVTIANQPITTHIDGTTQPVSFTSGVTLNSNVTLASPVSLAGSVTIAGQPITTHTDGTTQPVSNIAGVTVLTGGVSITSGNAVTVQPNSSVTVASANNVTITGALPTGSNGLGSVSITGPVTLSTGVTLSGSVTVASANNVTITGALPTGSNGLGSVSVTGPVSLAAAVTDWGLASTAMPATVANGTYIPRTLSSQGQAFNAPWEGPWNEQSWFNSTTATGTVTMFAAVAGIRLDLNYLYITDVNAANGKVTITNNNGITQTFQFLCSASGTCSPDPIQLFNIQSNAVSAPWIISTGITITVNANAQSMK